MPELKVQYIVGTNIVKLIGDFQYTNSYLLQGGLDVLINRSGLDLEKIVLDCSRLVIEDLSNRGKRNPKLIFDQIVKMFQREIEIEIIHEPVSVPV